MDSYMYVYMFLLVCVDFLPLLKSPLGLVGEEAANVQSQRTPLTNMSIKHPLIELQWVEHSHLFPLLHSCPWFYPIFLICRNSVHFLRKRSSQEMSQSVFHIETPGSPKSAHSDNPGNNCPITLLEYKTGTYSQQSSFASGTLAYPLSIS